MNTNQVEQLAQLANANGFHLTGEEVAAILSIGGVLIRWLMLELKLVIANGGIQGVFEKVFYGEDKPKISIPTVWTQSPNPSPSATIVQSVVKTAGNLQTEPNSSEKLTN